MTQREPVIVNALATSQQYLPPFFTNNPEKQKEIRRIVGAHVQFVETLEIEEIQSADPHKVVSEKAKAAWRANKFAPVIVEDVSLTILSLEHLLPSPYANEWSKTPVSRKQICELLGADRRVVARALYAVFDGRTVHIREGVTSGSVPSVPLGTNGFGWDDIFIPDGHKKTFAQMNGSMKDRFSMRRKALAAIARNPFPLAHPIFQLEEPFVDELARLRIYELVNNRAALHFAFQLEVLNKTKSNTSLTAQSYQHIHKQEVKDHGVTYFTRYTGNPQSPSLGLILTSISRARIKLSQGLDGEAVLYQMSPAQRKVALAQRIVFFKENQNKDIHTLIDEYESGKRPMLPRANRRYAAVEKALEIIQTSNQYDQAIQTVSLEQIGYRKQSSSQLVSRKIQSVDYLLNKIGKYYRRVLLGGSMPPATGGRDALVTAAMGHMAIFIPRNSVFAGNIPRQIHLAHEAFKTIDSLTIPTTWKTRAKRNIGASLGIDNPKKVLADAKALYSNAGIRLFRIYTIAADPRVVETAALLRKAFGDTIEVFVGQVADKKQALTLIDKPIRVDALIYGHGGGRQCTSAENGMGVTTLEEIYEITRDERFNQTTLLLEGGVGRNVGAMLILGADGVLYNQRIVHGTIESPAGDIFFVKNDNEFVQPYPGSASAETQLIESVDPKIRLRRTNMAGRIIAEGVSGFMVHKRKAGGSMAFWISSLLYDVSRMLADLGVKNLAQMRELVADDRQEFLRIVTPEARHKGSAYGRDVKNY